MSSLILSPGADEEAYTQIEAAVMETARGRWFLAEFARRNRHAETARVLVAIEKLQVSIANHPTTIIAATAAGNDGRLQNEILHMARAISAMQRELQAITASGATTAHVSSADDLDRVVHTTEQATTTILAAAERVQEFAWTLRENAGSAEDCDLLDRSATEIYIACAFQDLTAQRIYKVIEVLRFIDERIKALLVAHDLAEDFSADEAMVAEFAGPAPVRNDDVWMSEAHQAEIDETFAFFEPAADVIAEPTMVGVTPEMTADPAPHRVPSRPKETDAGGATDGGEYTAPALLVHAPSVHAPSVHAPSVHAPFAPAAAASLATDPYGEMTTTEKLRAFR